MRKAIVIAALLAIVGGAVAAPLRVGMPDMRRTSTERPTAALTYNCAVGTLLRERAAECTSFVLVSPGRTAAIMTELTTSGRELSPDKVPAAFARYQPVDAFVDYVFAGGKVTIRVMVGGDVKTTSFAAARVTGKRSFAHFRDLTTVVRRTVGFIAASLPLSASDRGVLTEKRIAKPEAFAAIYRSHRYPEPLAHAVNQHKIGGYSEIRLRVLNAVWKRHRREPHLAAEVLRNAEDLFQADAETQKEVFWVNYANMSREAFTRVLGTRFEFHAYPLARNAPGHFFKQTAPMVQRLLDDLDIEGGVDGALEAEDDTGAILADANQALLAADGMTQDVSRATRLGALRALGYLGVPETLPLIRKALQKDNAQIRAAAVAAAAVLPEAQAVPLLRPLARDNDADVALRAQVALAGHGVETPQLLPTLRARLAAGKPVPFVIAALAAYGATDDLAQLRPLAAAAGAQRPALLAARLRLGDADPEQMLAWLQDANEAVIQHALAAIATTPLTSVLRAQVVKLTNDPFTPIAESARVILSRSLPTDPLQRDAFRLRIEHPYFRLRILRDLAVRGGAAAVPLLQQACSNSDAHVRAKALTLLAARAPDAARSAVMLALADDASWVRQHAAAAAAVVADRTSVQAIKLALAATPDRASALYLRDALAKALGEPLPAAPVAALSIKGKKNLAWNTSPARYAPTSPFEAYYSMTTRADDHMRAAHRAGKAIFARAVPLVCPAAIVLDRTVRDEFWQNLDKELSAENLPYLDGVIYGEESMRFVVDGLWEHGWRLFCREAGIATDRVAGDKEKLTPSERRAWNGWLLEKNIEGFNILYEYTKMKFGKLRPGFQVCSFAPSEKLPYSGAPDAVKTWKFDMGGVYDYKGDNRLAGYSLIRRYKTIWPQRPVLWLSLGIGGYEMNPVKHHQKVPRRPMLDRYNRSFSDSLTAWMAGADTGWFSTWMFMSTIKGSASSMSRLRGVHIWVEDIAADSALLDRAIRYTFNGITTVKEEIKAPDLHKSPTDVLAGDDGELDDIGEALDDATTKAQQAKQAAWDAKQAAERKRLKDGFLFYQQYVYDCARIFASLPRRQPQPKALVVRPKVNVWTRPLHRQLPLIPSQGLLNEFDFLVDIDMAGVLDLSRYRLIIVHNPLAIRDRTIAALRHWLQTTPGLLVVHGVLPGAEAGTVADHDGVLQERWPWADAVAMTPRELPLSTRGDRPLKLLTDDGALMLDNGLITALYDVTGKGAQVFARVDKKPVLALWRGADSKGAVLFDGVAAASAPYQALLRQAIATVNDDVAALVSGPAALETMDTAAISAAASSRYYGHAKGLAKLSGVDVMTGDIDPQAGAKLGSKSALVLRNMTGRFVAASSQLSAVAQKPWLLAKIEGENLRLHCRGAARVASVTGRVQVSPVAGGELPVIAPSAFIEWLLYSDEPGVAELNRPAGQSITYFRAPAAVLAKPQKP